MDNAKTRRLFAYLLDHVTITTLLRAARHARTGANDVPRPTKPQDAVIDILIDQLGEAEVDP